MKILIKFCLIQLLLHALVAHAAITVTNIAQGCWANHSLFLKSGGSLWVMGLNADGSFTGTTNRPAEIIASNVTVIAAGGDYSLFLKSDGSLWGMGDRGYGQLGFPASLTRMYPPEQIVSNDVIAVAAGYAHALFLKSDGGLWAMGDDEFGQLGNGVYYGPFGPSHLPEEIVSNGVIAIAAGQYHSLFLKSDGSLWAMGWNGFGQLGDGNAFYPQLGFNFQYNTNLPEQIVAGGVTTIAAGGNHSLFIKSDGSLWAMGENDYGQLGNGTYQSTNQPQLIVSSNVIAIAAGGYHSLFLKSDGSLWAMGNDYYGQLGDNYIHFVDDYTNFPEQIISSNVVAMAAGLHHSLFIKNDGSLWGMGDSQHGQLGDGFNEYFSDGSPAPEQTFSPEQIVPSPRPVLAQMVSNTDLQLTATCGFGGNFYLLAGTNLGQPLSQWIPVWTNSVTTRGANNFSATLTNAVNSGKQQFYILQSQ
ncbi:MAG: hypothetical protein PHY43_10000 [Verrucomicrobiales bacterium]|nr:hypothetical protein [Verrucomicrobiales bacterium]